MDTTLTVTDLYRVVGEYLADALLRINTFSAQSASIRLSVADADSVRYAHTLTTPGRYSYVGTVAVEDRQLVTVVFSRADGVYVSVIVTVTDPLAVARLRALPDHAASPDQVLAALSDAHEVAP